MSICRLRKLYAYMIFNPHVKTKIISDSFPQFHLAGCNLSFVPNFKYIGHIIDNKFQDDDDVYRELTCFNS